MKGRFAADKAKAQRDTQRREAQRVRDRVKAAEEKTREVREETRATCADAHARCVKARERYAASRRERDDLRALAREYRLTHRAIRVREKASAATQRGRRGPGIARVQESDDAVLSNIPVELVPLWEQVKGSIRGSSRRSRTEAFLEYAESHPDEAIAAIEIPSDDDYAAQEAAWASRRRVANGPFLVALGWLSRLYIDGREHVAPRGTLLAYDPDAKKRGLVLVYGARTSRARAPRDAVRAYAETHWGKRGAWGVSSGDAPMKGRPVGRVTRVVYTTIKGGDRAPTDYDHPFEGTLPGAVVDARGRFQLRGGSYRVTSRGIVG